MNGTIGVKLRDQIGKYSPITLSGEAAKNLSYQVIMHPMAPVASVWLPPSPQPQSK